jgi:hypothetical protein
MIFSTTHQYKNFIILSTRYVRLLDDGTVTKLHFVSTIAIGCLFEFFFHLVIKGHYFDITNKFNVILI